MGAEQRPRPQSPTEQCAPAKDRHLGVFQRGHSRRTVDGEEEGALDDPDVVADDKGGLVPPYRGALGAYPREAQPPHEPTGK
jgi:hypothetical protein